VEKKIERQQDERVECDEQEVLLAAFCWSHWMLLPIPLVFFLDLKFGMQHAVCQRNPKFVKATFPSFRLPTVPLLMLELTSYGTGEKEQADLMDYQ